MPIMALRRQNTRFVAQPVFRIKAFLVPKLVPEGVQLRFRSMENDDKTPEMPFGTFQISGMADVVACIASSKPSLVQEKVDKMQSDVLDVLFQVCGPGHLNLWRQAKRSQHLHVGAMVPCMPVPPCIFTSMSAPGNDCSEAFVNKDVASLDDLPPGLLVT